MATIQKISWWWSTLLVILLFMVQKLLNFVLRTINPCWIWEDWRKMVGNQSTTISNLVLQEHFDEMWWMFEMEKKPWFIFEDVQVCFVYCTLKLTSCSPVELWDIPYIHDEEFNASCTPQKKILPQWEKFMPKWERFMLAI